MVAQWIRSCLPIQGPQVQSLVQEEYLCCGANKPVKLRSLCTARKSSLHSLQLEKVCAKQPRSGTAKNKKIKIKFKKSILVFYKDKYVN